MKNGSLCKAYTFACLALVCVVLGGVLCAIIDAKQIAFAEMPLISLSSRNEKDLIAVDVNLSGNSGLYVADFTLDYDKNALSLLRYERGSALGGMSLVATGNETSSEKFKLNFLADGGKNDSSNGKMLTLYFKSEVKQQTTTFVTLRYDVNNDVSKLQNGSVVPVQILVEGVEIIVKPSSNVWLIVLDSVAVACLVVLVVVRLRKKKVIEKTN